MEKRNAKAKIIVTVVVLISTLAFVGLGTYAWFTLSTKGEVSGIAVSMTRTGDEWPFEFIEQRTYDNWTTIGQVMDAYNHDDDDGWGKCITLGEVQYIDENEEIATRSADDCYQLRPISTSDLKDWYLPYYNGLGEVEQLTKATFSAVANINRYNPTASETGEDIPSNYLYYYDLWVRTLSDKYDYDLHLSNPLNASDVDASLYDEYDYGTFVLPAILNDNGVATISKAGYDMSRCLRVGFEIFKNNNPNDITDETRTGFWIYEPNYDSRAKYFTEYKDPITNAGLYNIEQGFTYILGNSEAENQTVSSQKSRAEGTDYKTYVPYIKNGEDTQSFKSIDDQTIKQKKSEWDMDRITESVLNQTHVDSTYIKTFGKFIKPKGAEDAEGLEGIDTPIFATVSKGTPIHIRVYIWMEGQDVDCWNSSLAGSLKIGLEFRGDAVEKQGSNQQGPVIEE